MSELPTDHRPAALVTGSAIRLGKAIALSLAGAGYDIALHYRSEPAKAAATAAEIRALGVRCQPFRADLANPPAIPSLISDAASHFPGLTVLVNSASAYTQATIANTTAAIFNTQFDVNLRAPLLLMQAFAEQIGRGNIINIIDNKIGFNQFEYAAYLLSKKALAELTRMAAVEFAPAIRVNGVAPGVVLPAGSRSDEYIAWRVQGIPLQRQGEADQIGQAILSLLQNEFITGHILVVDGGEALTNTGQNAAQFDPKKI